MPQKFHINNNGDVRECEAKLQECKFGVINHYTSPDDARKAYESSMAAETFPTTTTNETSQTSSFLPTETTPANVENIEQAIEGLELDHGNAEVFEQDDEIYITAEAPNHATVQIVLQKDSVMGEFYEQFSEASENFDADERMEEIWSPEFGKRNALSAGEFYRNLDADGTYFRETSDMIQFRLQKAQKSNIKQKLSQTSNATVNDVLEEIGAANVQPETDDREEVETALQDYIDHTDDTEELQRISKILS